MKLGTTFIEMTKLWVVEIVGRDGDSVRDAYFETYQQALFASAIDKQNKIPRFIEVLKFSDGAYMHPHFITVSSPPKGEEAAKLLEDLTPAQKELFEQAIEQARNEGKRKGNF